MLAVVAFLLLTLFIVPVEHLAFGRHPWFRQREWSRRAIGIGTVMLLGLIPVAFGRLDIVTWAVLLGGFLLAGAIWGGMVWVEERQDQAARLSTLRSVLHEQIERFHTDAVE